MKPMSMAFAVLLGLGGLAGCHSPPDTNPVSEGPYLNQSPPGTTPAPFAPGRVSTERFEYGGVFSPDLDEFYFIRQVEEAVEEGERPKQEFVVYEFKDTRWQDRVISPRVGQPFISPDGETLHLGKRYKTRDPAGWSEIETLDGAFEDYRIMRLTASSSGTYYFDEVGTDGDGKIRYSRLVNGERQDPELASDAINSGTWLAHPFIAPDESYILWDGRKDGGFGSSDIYVSFRQQDGEWGQAINLGDTINTDAWEASASVTPDGKYLFFHRNVGGQNVDIYWVDAKVLEGLKPDQQEQP